MDQLVTIDHGEPVTTSLIIAKGVKLNHKSVIQLVRQYEKDLNEFGTLAFEMRKSGGRKTEFAYLNEPQSTLLITFMRNNSVVLEFKKKLVKEFYRMKKTLTQVLVRQQNDEWRQLRAGGKETRKAQTDAIKTFVEYATAQGSKSANMYYANITKMENKALFLLEQKYDNLRDLLNGQQLQVIASADMIVEKALADGMERSMPYKEIYQMAKDRVETFAAVVPKMPVPSLMLSGTKH